MALFLLYNDLYSDGGVGTNDAGVGTNDAGVDSG